MTDYFENRLGQIHQGLWRPRVLGPVRDLIYDLGAKLMGAGRKTDAIAARTPRRRILVVGVAHPKRPGEMESVVEELRNSRHDVTASIVTMQEGLGKFQNISRAIAQLEEPMSTFDWVIVTDDDIGLERGFLDRFIGLVEHSRLAMAQPAHRFFSYTTFSITQRRWNSLARRTRFIEVGPLSAIRRDTLADLFPAPESRWDWGLDVYWAQIADRKGWPIGVIDGTPIEHRRPVAGGYNSDAAIAEAADFLDRHGVTMTRADCHTGSEVLVDWMAEAPAETPRQNSRIDHTPSSNLHR